MTHPLNAKMAGVLFACVTSVFPVACAGQTVDAAPSGSFTFGSFGSPQVDALPLEMSDESTDPLPRFPTVVTDLGSTPTAPGVQTTEVRTRVIQNTWSIGVFR